jgi:uncharacterized protein (AIM24 family)
MRSDLFVQANHEVEATARFTRQNSKMLRVALGPGSPDLLATKGSMVAYQGSIRFDHEGSGGVGKFLKKVLTSEDLPLMRVSGAGEVFFAQEAGDVYLVEMTGDALSVNGANLLAFDASLEWDIHRVQGAGTVAGGLYNTVVSGTGTVALVTVGQPVVLDCSAQPTYVDVQAAVGWSANLVPQVVSSMNMRSLLRGGSGESFQYAFSGPGFVVVQPSELSVRTQASATAAQGGGGLLGDLLR